jgi:hypothetical protein
MNHSSLETLVKDWLHENNIEDCVVVGLGRGVRGVEIVSYKLTAKEFIEKYEMIDNKYLKGWFSPARYSEHKIYVSIKKK